MDIRLKQKERDAIIDQLASLKARYAPTSSLGSAYSNLADFAKHLECAVTEKNDLATTQKAWGSIYPHFGIIQIQAANITRMLPTLAHEVGHLIAFKAGLTGYYNYREELADSLGEIVVGILMRQKEGVSWN